MTPAAIALAVLCGVLALVLLYALGAVKNMGDKIKEMERFSAVQDDLMEADSALIAEAHALLHDERHKGKLDNQKQWQAARAEWAGRVNGR